MLKTVYLSLLAAVLGAVSAWARGGQELHKDEEIRALHPPGEW
jgi:hypothetical protein